MKRIKETVTRWCCQPQDLMALSNDVGWRRREPQYKACWHCGQKYEYYRYMDAAGSMDYDYRIIEGEFVDPAPLREIAVALRRKNRKDRVVRHVHGW
jgi:hypothetical protein